MVKGSKLEEEIFKSEFDFEKTALHIFQFQAKENSVYKSYLEQLKINPQKINSVIQIPFLPIQFFKTHKIVSGAQQKTGNQEPGTIFISSGTTGSERSKNYVADLKIYEQSFIKCFELFYGNIDEYCLLVLLPSYSNDASLIYMASELIKRTKKSMSGFYLNDFEKLNSTIQELINQEKKFIVLGVTYSLLDYADRKKSENVGFNGHGIVMETGGMKGKRNEMLREEIHNTLCKAFDVKQIHSEYGMTEILSQAYSKGEGIFHCPPWMKIFIRDVNDPNSFIENGRTGGINIIDLANIYSCSFLATQDLGKKYDDGSFEILGRFDESDLRGCNLMIE